MVYDKDIPSWVHSSQKQFESIVCMGQPFEPTHPSAQSQGNTRRVTSQWKLPMKLGNKDYLVVLKNIPSVVHTSQMLVLSIGFMGQPFQPTRHSTQSQGYTRRVTSQWKFPIKLGNKDYLVVLKRYTKCGTQRTKYRCFLMRFSAHNGGSFSAHTKRQFFSPQLGQTHRVTSHDQKPTKLRNKDCIRVL